MSKSDYGKPPRSSGIGESKIHAAAAGTFEPNPLLSCHVGGVLVAELPPQLQQGIVFANTDEGIAQREEELRAKGRLKAQDEPRVEVTRTDWDNEMEGYGAADDPGARDPFKLAMDRHVEPGFAGKFMSKEALKRFGPRGYRVVKDDSGNPVERGNMVLGEIPKELRDKRKERFKVKDIEQQKTPAAEFQAQQEQINSQAGIPLAQARRVNSGGVGLQDDMV